MIIKPKFIMFFILILCLHQLSAQVSESYKQQWNNLEIQGRINSGIENYRKGWGKISFVDAGGKPVNNVDVKIEQQSHKFLFGADIFVLGQFKTQAENRKYEESLTRLFNFATYLFTGRLYRLINIFPGWLVINETTHVWNQFAKENSPFYLLCKTLTKTLYK